MKFAGYKTIEGTIEVVTGLHIGGSTAIIEIGGRDLPVIKHPITKEPYIPGSSLKGKMRSLLEWKLDIICKVKDDSIQKYGFHSCISPDCPVCVIFGTSADNADFGPTRLIVRDSVICDKYMKEQKDRFDNWTAFDLTESKSENSINRINAGANPRNFERVVSGVRFKFNIIYRVFTISDEALFVHVLNALRMIERDALGGAGSRGCGQVAFKVRVKRELEGKLKEVHLGLNEVNSEDFPTIADGA
jgi:CRISPR-associated protein Csm3